MIIETPSLLSPCGSYQVDFYPIKGQPDLFFRIGTFNGITEFKETVSKAEMLRDIERKRFRYFKTIQLNRIPQELFQRL